MFTYRNTRTGVTFLSASQCAGADIVLVPSENKDDHGKRDGGKNGKRGNEKNGKNASEQDDPKPGTDQNGDVSGADDASSDVGQSGNVSDSDTLPTPPK